VRAAVGALGCTIRVYRGGLHTHIEHIYVVSAHPSKRMCELL
jgi:hypothetical protein